MDSSLSNSLIVTFHRLFSLPHSPYLPSYLIRILSFFVMKVIENSRWLFHSSDYERMIKTTLMLSCFNLSATIKQLIMYKFFSRGLFISIRPGLKIFS